MASQTSDYDSEFAALLDAELFDEDEVETQNTQQAAPIADQAPTPGGIAHAVSVSAAGGNSNTEGKICEPAEASGQLNQLDRKQYEAQHCTVSAISNPAVELADGTVTVAQDQSTDCQAGISREPKRRRVMVPSGRIADPGGVGASSDGTCPPHPGFMFGLCIRCGLPKAGDTDSTPASADNGSAPGTMTIKHLHAKQALEVR